MVPSFRIRLWESNWIDWHRPSLCPYVNTGRQLVDFRGRKFYTPRGAAAVLRDMYGPGWRTPLHNDNYLWNLPSG